MNRRIITIAAVTLSVAVLPLIGSGHARASTRPPTKLWLIKQNDLATIGTRYASDFRWVACGQATQTGPQGVPGGRCHRGQVQTFASYWNLAKAVAAGHVGRGTTILFDQEIWVFTPKAEAADPAHYAKLIGQLCRAHGIRLIFTVNGWGQGSNLQILAAAAPYAYAISVQTQVNDQDVAKFRQYARRSRNTIKAINPNVRIMFGLATDAGGTPVTARQMEQEYWQTYPMADGFWLNANPWAPPSGKGCGTTGCPKVADAFLSAIHAP